MTGVLVAGIGNVFLGDDGFGVEVIRRLDQDALPDAVTAVDYGIRGVHLAYDLLDGRCATLILVDALPTGEVPGTLTVLDVGADVGAEIASGPASVDSHAMHPEAVLAALQALGGHIDRVLVIGCEPASVAPGMQLSEPVSAALDTAAELVMDVAAAEAAALRTTQPVETR